jgi:hypothetical protein
MKFIYSKNYFLITLLYLAINATLHAQSILSFEIKSSKQETAQIYYDNGSGFSEVNSAKTMSEGSGINS